MTLSIDDTTPQSPNYDERPSGVVIEGIVLHDGEGTEKSDLHELTTPGTKKSAHYYVARSAKIYQLVDPHSRAWHAGESSYQGRTSWNDFSIGIESEHKAGQDWPVVQKQAFHDLCAWLVAHYPIKQRYVAPHRWIARGRKFDPTNWPDEELTPWIASLFAVTPWSYQIPGPNGMRQCGKGFSDYYARLGGFDVLGYALTDETPSTDSLGRACTFLVLERAVFKYVAVEGVHLALWHEALQLGWIK